MGAERMPVDPDTGIPDLISRLGDDAKRLVTDELRLVKLEMHDNLKRAGMGAMWLGAAFGAGLVMLVAVTLFLATLIGRLAAGHMWVGAIVTGVVELTLAAWLVMRGLSAFTKPSYSLEQTRQTLGDTARHLRAVH
jgi:hypothetical protein